MKINAKIIGRCLETLFLLLIPTMIIVVVINNFFPDMLVGEKIIAATEDLYGFNLNKLSLFSRALFVFVNGISTSFIIYGLLISSKIARLFSNGESFSESSASLFARLKAIVLCWGLFNIVTQIVFSRVYMTKMSLRLMLVSVSFAAIFYMLIFILIAAIAGVIARAARLQKDQDLTV